MNTLAILALSGLLLLTRLLTLLPPSPRVHLKRNTPTRLLITLGSGGHTAEMLSLLRTLDPYSYTHRTYLISSGDSFSAERAVDFEASLLEKVKKVRREMGRGEEEECWGVRGAFYGGYDVRVVPRARRVHQSLLSTPVSALRCLLACFAVLRAPELPLSSASPSPPTRAYPPPNPLPRRPQPPQPLRPAPQPHYTYPHLILTNGPATATILILASLILRFFLAPLPQLPNPLPQVPNPLWAFFPSTEGKLRTIYVESFARVRKMSLSGRILVICGMCERVVVQWEGLASPGWEVGGAAWGRREFRGVLVD